MTQTIPPYSEEIVDYKYRFPPQEELKKKLNNHLKNDPQAATLHPLVFFEDVISKAASLFAGKYLNTGQITILNQRILRSIYPNLTHHAACYGLTVAVKECALNIFYRFPRQDKIIQELSLLLTTNDMLRLGHSLYPMFFTQEHIQTLGAMFEGKKMTVMEIDRKTGALMDRFYDEKVTEEHLRMWKIIAYAMRKTGHLTVESEGPIR